MTGSGVVLCSWERLAQVAVVAGLAPLNLNDITPFLPVMMHGASCLPPSTECADCAHRVCSFFFNLKTQPTGSRSKAVTILKSVLIEDVWKHLPIADLLGGCFLPFTYKRLTVRDEYLPSFRRQGMVNTANCSAQPAQHTNSHGVRHGWHNFSGLCLCWKE